MNSFNGYINKFPLFKLWLLFAPLWIPMILFVNAFNIGEPEEPLSVEHKWVIL